MPDTPSTDDAERSAPRHHNALAGPEGAARHFEALHQAGDEPWAFSERGVERLRHERIAAIARSHAPSAMLDIGCSLGQLTGALAQLPGRLVALDVSPTAAQRARARLLEAGRARARLDFTAASAMQMPFAPASFDLVVASDGLVTWQLDAGQRAATLREIHAVLRPGGHALLTEHMRPTRFADFVDEVRASPLRVVDVRYLHDRPCYQFESWLRAVSGSSVARRLRANVRLARLLTALGRPFGARGSRHVLIVARRAER
jgi:SAM-dependent methyltransferase